MPNADNSEDFEVFEHVRRYVEQVGRLAEALRILNDVSAKEPIPSGVVEAQFAAIGRATEDALSLLETYYHPGAEAKLTWWYFILLRKSLR
ncbi:MAG: hypothetical protein AAF871_03645 [Pseudomonadota bacterium]